MTTLKLIIHNYSKCKLSRKVFFSHLSPKLALGFKYAEVTPGGLERLVGDPNDGWFAAFGGVN